MTECENFPESEIFADHDRTGLSLLGHELTRGKDGFVGGCSPVYTPGVPKTGAVEENLSR